MCDKIKGHPTHRHQSELLDSLRWRRGGLLPCGCLHHDRVYFGSAGISDANKEERTTSAAGTTKTRVAGTLVSPPFVPELLKHAADTAEQRL